MIIVDIDIKPGSFPNSINLSSKGVIPVAILSGGGFDATSVDPTTVRFGPAGAEYAHRRTHVKDANHDGLLDLLMHFPTQDTGIPEDATEACLTGQTIGGGQDIQGCDSVRIVPPHGDADLDSQGVGLPRLTGDDVEASTGCDQLRSCPDGPDHDAWPPDVNNDSQVSLDDVEMFRGRLQAVLGEPGYRQRLDLFFDGEMTVQDAAVLRPFYGMTCLEANPDADDDGFRNQEEMIIGTDPLTSCGVLAWPPDFNDNATVNIIDVLSIKPHYGSTSPDPQYSVRHDLTPDGAVNLFDILALKPHFLGTCN